MKPLFALFLGIILGNNSAFATECSSATLKNAAACHDVLVGSPIRSADYDDVLSRERGLFELSVLTATTYIKQTQPERGRFNWKLTDRDFDIAERNGMKIHGHPLIWGSDYYQPEWLMELGDPKQVEAVFSDYIKRAVQRYQGRIHYWDVINEGIRDDGKGIRDSVWKRGIGPSYIERAFRLARKYDQGAHLIYNEYGTAQAGKVESKKFQYMKKMLNDMKADNVPIDGVGWQMHATVDKVLSKDFPLKERLHEIAALGFVNHITELDIRIDSTSEKNLEKQKRAFKKVATAFLSLDKSKRGTFGVWGISDKNSWLNWFLKKREFPLLFDDLAQKKPAYYGVLEAFLEESTLSTPEEETKNYWEQEPKFAQGTYYIKNKASGRYLGRIASDRVSSIQAESEPGESSLWKLKHSDGRYRLLAASNNKFLLEGIETTESEIVLSDSEKKGFQSQQWHFVANEGEYVQLVNHWKGTALAEIGATEPQSKIITAELDSEDERQQWILEVVSISPTRLTRTKAEKKSGFYLLQNRESQRYLSRDSNKESNSVVERRMQTPKRDFAWELVQEGEIYRVRSLAEENTYLNSGNVPEDKRVDVHAYYDDWQSEQWQLYSINSTYFQIVNLWKKKALAVELGSLDGWNVAVVPLESEDNKQHWVFEEIEPSSLNALKESVSDSGRTIITTSNELQTNEVLKGGTFAIQNRASQGYLDRAKGHGEYSDIIEGSNKKSWRLSKVDKAYRIFEHSAPNDSLNSGTDLLHPGVNVGPDVLDWSSQKWLLRPVDNGYFQLINVWKEKALAVESNSQIGSDILVLPIASDDHKQHWRFSSMAGDRKTSASQPITAAVATSNKHPRDGQYFLKNRESGRYLNRENDQDFSDVLEHEMNKGWKSLGWKLVKLDSGYRIYSLWGDSSEALNSGNSLEDTGVQVAPEHSEWTSQVWQLHPVDGKYFQLINEWKKKALSVGSDSGSGKNLTVLPSDKTSSRQHWSFERYSD